MVRHKISQVVIDQKNQYSEFKELFISLVNNYKSAYKTHIFSYKCVTNKSSKLKQTLDLYKEILIILERIDNELIVLQELEKGERKYWRAGKIGLKSKLGIIFSIQDTQRALLTVDIKSLFQWIFILDNVLGNNIFPKTITAFRNIFITHLSEKTKDNKRIRKLMTSSVFSPYNYQLNFIPFFGSKKFAGFSTIQNEIKRYIPEVTREKNNYEKVRIIWGNLHKLPVTLTGGSQKNTHHFLNRLSQYGNRTPSLLEIVRALIKVWDKKVKKLF